MLGLGWWQLQRAVHGHTRSWAYTVQWPLFAAYVVYMWWRLLREEPGFAGSQTDSRDAAAGDAAPSGEAATAAAEDRATAEYNEYLASLKAGRPKRRR